MATASYGSFSITISNQGFSATVAGRSNRLWNQPGVRIWHGRYRGNRRLSGGIGLCAGDRFQLPHPVRHARLAASREPDLLVQRADGQVWKGDRSSSMPAPPTPTDPNASNYHMADHGPRTAFPRRSSGAEPMLTLGDPGTYAVTVTAGNNLSESSTITAANVPPTITSLGNLAAYAAGVQQTITPAVVVPAPRMRSWNEIRLAPDPQRPAVRSGRCEPRHQLAGLQRPPLPSGSDGNPDIYAVEPDRHRSLGRHGDRQRHFRHRRSGQRRRDDRQGHPGDPTQGISLRKAIDVQYTSTQSGYFSIKFAPSLAYQTITLTTADDTTDHGEVRSRSPPMRRSTSMPPMYLASPSPRPREAWLRAHHAAILPRPQCGIAHPGTRLWSEAWHMARGPGNRRGRSTSTATRSCSWRIPRSWATRPSGTWINVAQGPGYAGSVNGADGRGGAIFVNTNGSLSQSTTPSQATSRSGRAASELSRILMANVPFTAARVMVAQIDNNGGMILSNDTFAANSVANGGTPTPGATAHGAGILETRNNPPCDHL